MARYSSASAPAPVRDGADASPLLGRMLKEYPDVFEREVLKKRLDPTDCALLARACYKCGEAVASAGVVRAGSPGLTFKVKDFVVTVELLAWAKANGCPWESRDDDLWRCRHSLSYWVCICFILGSLLFTVGCALWYKVHLYAQSITYVFLCGSVFFTAGGYLGIFEAINVNRRGPLRLWAWAPHEPGFVARAHTRPLFDSTYARFVGCAGWKWCPKRLRLS
jgi:hypothetical protein